MQASQSKTSYSLPKLLALAGAALLVSACSSTQSMPPVSEATRAQIPHEIVFQAPQEAVETLVGATRTDQTEEMVKILGPQSKKLVYSGDKVADNASRDRFVAAYDAAHSLEADGADRQWLIVGEQEWPMPIPLVRVKGGWQWDTAAGANEILNRRIGKNELNVIGVARAYVEAQNEYGDRHPVGKYGHHEYAQQLISDKGKRNGLYWPVRDGEQESPLGPLVAQARAEGYTDKKGHLQHSPYHGYFFKILKSQGSHAAGGAKDYINKKGRMTGGFALLAFPAKYGNSGVMSFIVNENGIVYEKNLGANTIKTAPDIEAYDPDKSWKVVE